MIQKKLDGVCFEVATIRRSDQVCTLECLQVGVKVGKTVIHIEALILFHLCNSSSGTRPGRGNQ